MTTYVDGFYDHICGVGDVTTSRICGCERCTGGQLRKAHVVRGHRVEKHSTGITCTCLGFRKSRVLSKKKGRFSSVVLCSHAGFSMPPGELTNGFVCGNRAFSSGFSRLTISECKQSRLKGVVSALINIIGFQYGVVMHGRV